MPASQGQLSPALFRAMRLGPGPWEVIEIQNPNFSFRITTEEIRVLIQEESVKLLDLYSSPTQANQVSSQTNQDFQQKPQ